MDDTNLKQKNIYAIGVFDLFHAGHLAFLQKCKAIGGNLTVAINGDDMVASYKRIPFFNEKDRLAIISALEIVDQAFIIDKYDNKQYLIDYDIDYIVHGDDWEADSYKEQIRVTDEFLKEHGIELAFVGYTAGVSTSALIQKIKES